MDASGSGVQADGNVRTDGDGSWCVSTSVCVHVSVDVCM